MKQALSDLWSLGIFFVLFLFIYTIWGKEWFAYKAKFNSDWEIDIDNGKYID